MLLPTRRTYGLLWGTQCLDFGSCCTPLGHIDARQQLKRIPREALDQVVRRGELGEDALLRRQVVGVGRVAAAEFLLEDGEQLRRQDVGHLGRSGAKRRVDSCKYGHDSKFS